LVVCAGLDRVVFIDGNSNVSGLVSPRRSSAGAKEGIIHFWPSAFLQYSLVSDVFRLEIAPVGFYRDYYSLGFDIADHYQILQNLKTCRLAVDSLYFMGQLRLGFEFHYFDFELNQRSKILLTNIAYEEFKRIRLDSYYSSYNWWLELGFGRYFQF
jgi:hypothetical protein